MRGTALMEKTDAAPDAAPEYLEVKPREGKISEAASRGYRVVPRMLSGDPERVIMERGSSKHYQYRLLRTKDIPTSLSQVVEEGYTIVGLMGYSVLMEKLLEEAP